MAKAACCLWQRERLDDIPGYGLVITDDDKSIKYVPELSCKFTANEHENGVCSNCGFEAGMYDGWDPFALEYTNKRCPECGAKVVG